MRVKIIVKFNSKPGESVVIFLKNKQDEHVDLIQLEYADTEHWEAKFELTKAQTQKQLFYTVVLKSELLPLQEQVLFSYALKLKKVERDAITIRHDSYSYTNYPNFNGRKPFEKVLKPQLPEVENVSFDKATHVFIVPYPLLQKNTFLCLTGSAEKMNFFDKEKPLLFKRKKNNTGIISLNLQKEIFPIEYKIGIFDAEKNTVVEYEPGQNRQLQKNTKAELEIIYLDYNLKKYLWRGAGINIPVFSIRTQKSWGSGDFADIEAVADYAALVGIKLIQLLPVNDTTSTLFDKDSYPYSAISSFALHPKLLSTAQLATQYEEPITEKEQVEIQRLNSLSYCDHAGVINLKFTILRRIFEKNKQQFLEDEEWFSFFNLNSHWLVPYAFFCVCRDEFGTLNYDLWPDHNIYEAEKIQAIVTNDAGKKDQVLFWYFVQYHLHLQLAKATTYANTKGIILKADLPIGVGRHSADTWVNPQLFNLNTQAGAPPDAFSSLGQNWSFPTYNVPKMAEDNFDWFRKRMQQLEYYFDAVRIDHVLGLFRIWSIPQNQRNGTMGKFVPAIPVTVLQIGEAGIDVDITRLCEPYITEQILENLFGPHAPEIKRLFLDGLRFKEEFNDQAKIAAYIFENSSYRVFEQSLFDLLANVILLKDDVLEDGYHFRINMSQTSSFQYFSEQEKNSLQKLYNSYFYEYQNELWKKEGIVKLEMLYDATGMLLCAEDLGMVPDFTEEVLHSIDIISLQVQQMPKDLHSFFSDTTKADYESVVMPATHDMSPIRLWWEQDREKAQLFYNTILNEPGYMPYFCEPWICTKIINEHLQSPAMWSIFMLQDLLSINGDIRRKNPAEERINDPSNPDHVWNYRMHVTVEALMEQHEFNNPLKQMILQSGR